MVNDFLPVFSLSMNITPVSITSNKVKFETPYRGSNDVLSPTMRRGQGKYGNPESHRNDFYQSVGLLGRSPASRRRHAMNLNERSSVDDLQRELRSGLLIIGPPTAGFAKKKSPARKNTSPTPGAKRKWTFEDLEIKSREAILNQLTKHLAERKREQAYLAEKHRIARSELVC
jgi:hypothetical protein